MGENNNDDELLFHRHCQATVLSAYGIGGRGATWDTINNLLLPHIEEIAPRWKTYFTDNYNNMTEDLSAILELMNYIVGKRKPQVYRISFKNNNGDTIVPEQELEPNTTFGGFGRNIELKVNDQTLQFNTMVKDSGTVDKLSITIPIPTVSGGDLVDVATDGTSNTISVKNSIPRGYEGPIGINENRELVVPPPLEAKLTQEMFNQLWPIGSIYISVNPFQPFQGIPDVNSRWEQLLTGRALWNVPTDSPELGQEIAGIFPNHHHDVESPRNITCEYLHDTEKGHGYIDKKNTQTTSTELDEGVTDDIMVGETLRPPSIAVTMWKRIA